MRNEFTAIIERGGEWYIAYWLEAVPRQTEIPNRLAIEIDSTWRTEGFKAWLLFKPVLRGLHESHIQFSRLMYDSDRLRSETECFLLTNQFPLKELGKPSRRVGMDPMEALRLEHVWDASLDSLPHFEWIVADTKVVHSFIDHWGIVPHLSLRSARRRTWLTNRFTRQGAAGHSAESAGRDLPTDDLRR